MTKSIQFFFASLTVLTLWSASPVLAVPVQGTEPAIHVGAPPPAASAPHWRTFTSVEGRFSVLLPSAPELRTVVLSPIKETLQQFICRAYTGAYLVQYADRPAEEVQLLGTEKILALANRAFIKRNQGSAITQSHLMVQGHLGYEIVAARNNGSRESQCVYLVGTRRYTLVTLQRRDQAEADPAASERFLSSFALLPAVPNTKMPNTEK